METNIDKKEERLQWQNHASEMKNMRQRRRTEFEFVLKQFRRMGFDCERISDYQWRIQDCIDIFPSNKRFFDIKKKQWGDIRGISFERFLRNYFNLK